VSGGAGTTGAGGSTQCGTTCPAGTWNLDGDATTGACGCEYTCNKISDADPIDAAFTDDNCDGSDGVVAQCVFVSATLGSVAGAGTRAQPTVSIARGIDLARTNGLIAVCVGGGVYAEAVTVVSGINIYGGFDATNASFAFPAHGNRRERGDRARDRLRRAGDQRRHAPRGSEESAPRHRRRRAPARTAFAWAAGRDACSFAMTSSRRAAAPTAPAAPTDRRQQRWRRAASRAPTGPSGAKRGRRRGRGADLHRAWRRRRPGGYDAQPGADGKPGTCNARVGTGGQPNSASACLGVTGAATGGGGGPCGIPGTAGSPGVGGGALGMVVGGLYAPADGVGRRERGQRQGWQRRRWRRRR
jgi:hypothetical protein